jgi:hypothetical protein
VKNSDKDSRLPIEPRRWADQLLVDRTPQTFEIRGDVLPLAKVDLFQDAEHAEVSPYVLFANCQDDDSLANFVRRYGPVAACEHSVDYPLQPDITESWPRFQRAFLDYRRANPDQEISRTSRLADRRVKGDAPPTAIKLAVQRLDELRNDREILAAMLDIVRIVSEELRDGQSNGRRERHRSALTYEGRLELLVESTRTLVTGTARWVDQHSREQDWLGHEGYNAQPGWKWSHSHQELIASLASQVQVESSLAIERDDLFVDPFLPAQMLVSELLNAFPQMFAWLGPHALEVEPPFALEFGVRPILYAMLRNDLKRGRQLRRCAWQECNDFFHVSRSDRLCCKDSCSKKLFSQKYHEETLKPRRDKAKRAKIKRRKNR